MNVADCCNRAVATISPDQTVQTAAEVMRRHHVGDLVVAEGELGRQTPLGVITDRDLVVEVMAAELTPRDLLVKDILTEELLVVQEDKNLLDVLDLMRARGVRRVPVINDHNLLVGILAMDDVLELSARMLENMAILAHRQRAMEIDRRP